MLTLNNMSKGVHDGSNPADGNPMFLWVSSRIYKNDTVMLANRTYTCS